MHDQLSMPYWRNSLIYLLATARCTYSASAVLLSYVVSLSVRLSVTLRYCGYYRLDSGLVRK